MNNIYIISVIAVMAAVTATLRFLPFVLLDRGEKLPKWVTYLGCVLPPAVMSMLLVYCLRSVNFLAGNHGLPEIICVGAAVLLHSIKRNTLLSIGVSTALYMIFVQSGIFA